MTIQYYEISPDEILFNDNGSWAHREEVEPYEEIVKRLAELANSDKEKTITLLTLGNLMVESKLLIEGE